LLFLFRSDLHPKKTLAADPWELDPSQVGSLNMEAATSSTIDEVWVVDDSPFHVVTSDDTLVGVSLKYNVSVS